MIDEVHARLEFALTRLRGTEREVAWALGQLGGRRGTVLEVAHAEIVGAIATLEVALSRRVQGRRRAAAVIVTSDR